MILGTKIYSCIITCTFNIRKDRYYLDDIILTNRNAFYTVLTFYPRRIESEYHLSWNLPRRRIHFNKNGTAHDTFRNFLEFALGY